MQRLKYTVFGHYQSIKAKLVIIWLNTSRVFSNRYYGIVEKEVKGRVSWSVLGHILLRERSKDVSVGGSNDLQATFLVQYLLYKPCQPRWTSANTQPLTLSPYLQTPNIIYHLTCSPDNTTIGTTLPLHTHSII